MILNGDEHDGFGCVVPVLYEYLFAELVIFLEIPVHLIVEFLVVFDEAQIEHE